MSSYTTAIDLITACLDHAPKKCTQSGNFQFDIKLELTTGIHAFIDHAFVNIIEFKMLRQLTATKTSHEK